ncbi:dihydrofolate reductase family protein [Streptomyces sp. BR1]|uniref:dihydrofolate reductase family protein n=1 Tax=Streptomyces sp. BR1 TaxID=1592323 RepID=UPI00402BB3CE
MRDADLVDEYRLLTFPTVLGAGRRLFPVDGPPADLELLDVEHVGPGVLTRYRRT